MINTQPENFEDEAERIQQNLEERARKQADKLIRKNSRELKRLKSHAEKCLLTNNKDGYIYAIKKLREFYRQPYNHELICTMWETSRSTLIEKTKEYAKQLKAGN